MNRTERLKIIREIVKDNKISSQDKLISELKDRGLDVTQSTVSRDIKSLNLVKVRDAEQKEYYGYSTKYSADPQVEMKRIRSKFRDNVISVDRAKNIIVIKTNPGEAQGVAAAIDGSNFDKIMGTVAGDDTIICVIDDETNAEKMIALFRNL
jgi:transcriptional regulator of arginine metabolism